MPTDPLRAELLRLREIAPPEEAAAIERVLVEERQRLAYRDESTAAGVVTKRIDRADGASEVSFYAIGSKRSTHAEAALDLGRLVTDPSDLRDFVFSCPACGDPSAQTTEHDVDMHGGASFTCDRCGAQVHFEALTREQYLAFASAPQQGVTR